MTTASHQVTYQDWYTRFINEDDDVILKEIADLDDIEHRRPLTTSEEWKYDALAVIYFERQDDRITVSF